MGRKINDKKTPRSFMNIPDMQYIIVGLTNTGRGAMGLVISESTFVNENIAIIALEAAEDSLREGLFNSDYSLPDNHKIALVEGEDPTVTVVYEKVSQGLDEINIKDSSFPCDAFTLIAIRMAITTIKMMIEKQMERAIVTPGDGIGGMPQSGIPGGKGH